MNTTIAAILDRHFPDATSGRRILALAELEKLLPAPPTVHVWHDDGWGTFAAACGQSVDGIKHVGRTPLTFAELHRGHGSTCMACVNLLETP